MVQTGHVDLFAGSHASNDRLPRFANGCNGHDSPPNSAVPIVTVIGIGIALLISGVVITETVFNIPGLGRLTVDAVLKRDYPIVQGLILVFAAAKVVVNLLIDISYAFLDPRIRY